MVVEDIMTRDPVTVDSESPISEALRILHELEVRHLPVVDNGELVGMVSDRDLKPSEIKALEGAVELEDSDSPPDPMSLPVASVMTGGVVSVTPEDEVTDVIDLMLEHKVGAVPVVERHGDTLVGIVSYIDVLREARELFEG